MKPWGPVCRRLCFHRLLLLEDEALQSLQGFDLWSSLVHRWSSPSAHGPRLWASDIILGLVHVSQVAGNLRAIRLAGCVAACYNKWITKQNVIVSTKKKSATSFTQSPIESQATLSMALWIGGCTVLGVLGLAGAGGGSGISTGALAVFQRLSK